MSDTTPASAVGINPNAAVANATDDVDKHTPDAPISNDPPAPAADPTDGADKKGDLADIVGKLGEAVEALQNTVATLIAPDASPTERLPWTHRGGSHGGK